MGYAAADLAERAAMSSIYPSLRARSHSQPVTDRLTFWQSAVFLYPTDIALGAALYVSHGRFLGSSRARAAAVLGW
jgi:hypothetical protein